jgi:tRNA(Ile)-lysidine synthase
VRAVARREGWNLEDAARRLRYQFFDEVVAQGRVAHAAVAHTADDQAETVLAHLVRGTGLTGLAGIHPVLGAIVRPLLEIRRQELREYLVAAGQTWREDATNLDTRACALASGIA